MLNTKWLVRFLSPQPLSPTAAWKALVTLCDIPQKASTCFVAYEKFFSIRRHSDESPALSARVELAMGKIYELRPLSFDLKTSDTELSCMPMIHCLGTEYSHFALSLALLTDLDKVKIKYAFQT